jgi:exodeoxyribonuclease III
MKIASWNVNSIKARLPNVLRWLEEAQPDIVGLQELKCIDEAFPRAEIEALGYNVETHGQKTYNGVALLSKLPLEDVSRGLPDFEDEQSRYIEAVVSTPKGAALRVASLYLPNGNPTGDDGQSRSSSEAVARHNTRSTSEAVAQTLSPKYTYKLAWMAALEKHAQTLLGYEEAFILSGDYNVIPTPEDCYNPASWEGDALYRPETHAAFRRIVNLGLTEAVASSAQTGDDTYTFWDYQAGAWPKNNGIRIDHHLMSPLAADMLAGFDIHRHTRDWEKPSDHVPVVIELDA